MHSGMTVIWSLAIGKVHEINLVFIVYSVKLFEYQSLACCYGFDSSVLRDLSANLELY